MHIATERFYALVITNLLWAPPAWCLARPSIRASTVFVVVALMWLLRNGPVEGHIVIAFNLQHGVTESDLLAVIIAATSAWRSWRQR